MTNEVEFEFGDSHFDCKNLFESKVLVDLGIFKVVASIATYFPFISFVFF